MHSGEQVARERGVFYALVWTSVGLKFSSWLQCAGVLKIQKDGAEMCEREDSRLQEEFPLQTKGRPLYAYYGQIFTFLLNIKY